MVTILQTIPFPVISSLRYSLLVCTPSTRVKLRGNSTRQMSAWVSMTEVTECDIRFINIFGMKFISQNVKCSTIVEQLLGLMTLHGYSVVHKAIRTNDKSICIANSYIFL